MQKFGNVRRAKTMRGLVCDKQYRDIYSTTFLCVCKGFVRAAVCVCLRKSVCVCAGCVVLCTV